MSFEGMRLGREGNQRDDAAELRFSRDQSQQQQEGY